MLKIKVGFKHGVNRSGWTLVKLREMCSLLFFTNFLLVLIKFLYWVEEWTLGYNYMQFWVSYELLGCALTPQATCIYNFVTNSHTLFICGEWKICSNIKEFQTITTTIAVFRNGIHSSWCIFISKKYFIFMRLFLQKMKWRYTENKANLISRI